MVNEIDDNTFEADYFKFGRAFHSYILENKKFTDNFVVLDVEPPSNAIQKKFCGLCAATNEINDEHIINSYSVSYSTKGKSKESIEKSAKDLFNQYKSYIEFLFNNGTKDEKTILSSDSFKKISDIDAEVRYHPIAKKYIYDDYLNSRFKSYNEHIILFEKDGVPMKCKIDRLLIDEENKEIIILDLKSYSLKTTTRPAIVQIIESIYDLDYPRQLAVYDYAVKSTLENPSEWIFYHKIVTAQTNILPDVRVFDISRELLIEGTISFENLFRRYKFAVEHGFDYDMETLKFEEITI
jgi:hypothetical protein